MINAAEYTAMLLGAPGNVGGHILHLLVQSPLCKKVVIVTRRNVAELANPKVQQVVMNMDKLEEELAPHAKGVDIALAAFGVGKGSAKMADEEFLGLYRPGVILGNRCSTGDAFSLPFNSQERPGARHGRAVGAGVRRARAGQR